LRGTQTQDWSQIHEFFLGPKSIFHMFLRILNLGFEKIPQILMVLSLPFATLQMTLLSLMYTCNSNDFCSLLGPESITFHAIVTLANLILSQADKTYVGLDIY